MSKKHKIQQPNVQKSISQQKKIDSYTTGISKKGWKIIIISICTLILGFILLKFTNPEGDNWASILSPIVIVLSYIFIAVGILAKD